MQSVTGKEAGPGVQVESTDITKLTQKEKNVSGTFRDRQDGDQSRVSGLSDLSVPVLGGKVQRQDPRQTGDGLVRVPEHGKGITAHCNVCARAGFKPVNTEWEDPRVVALRGLAHINLHNNFDYADKEAIEKAVKIISLSLFKDEMARQYREVTAVSF